MSDLPKIALQRLRNAAAGSHPDLNLLGAFAENALSRDSRDQILQHLAECIHCREVVFLSTPDQAAAVAASASTPSSWLTWPVLRWGAAVAAVVVVGAAISLHRQPERVSTSPDAIQMTDAPSAKEKAASASLPEEKPQMDASTGTAPAPPAMKNDTARDVEGKRPDQLKKQSARVTASPLAARNSEAAGDRVASERRDDLDKTATVEIHAGSSPASVNTDQVVPGRAKDAASQLASNMSRASSAGGARPQMFMPMVAPRWTLTSEGALQRSLDLGRSWQTVPVSSQASFRALAANGKDIWVGGSNGALYHSTDAGQHWAQVHPVATGQALTDDIVGVEFPDALHGTLTTTGKETWTTEDAGQTWRKP